MKTISLTPAVLTAIAATIATLPTWLLILATLYVAVFGAKFLRLALDRYDLENERRRIRNERRRRRLPPAANS